MKLLGILSRNSNFCPGVRSQGRAHVSPVPAVWGGAPARSVAHVVFDWGTKMF